MATTPIIVASSTVSGNIGSCTVNVSNVSTDSWHNETIAINSCTGQIMSDHTYYDWGYIYFPLMIVVVVVLIAGIIRIASD